MYLACVAIFIVRSSENPELKVYVEDALRLVLAARPERPLDIINDYLHRYDMGDINMRTRVAHGILWSVQNG